jgi:hypothetical protein
VQLSHPLPLVEAKSTPIRIVLAFQDIRDFRCFSYLMQHDATCTVLEMADNIQVQAAFDATNQFLHPILDRGRQMKRSLVNASMELTYP